MKHAISIATALTAVAFLVLFGYSIFAGLPMIVTGVSGLLAITIGFFTAMDIRNFINGRS